MKTKPYIPIWKRPPNTFLKYEERPFDDGHGHSAVLRIAVYKDKKGNVKEEVAQVKWQ